MSKIEWTDRKAYNVPFFFKQWGEYLPHEHEVALTYKMIARGITANTIVIWVKVGKSKSGHLLDGKEYREFPTNPGNL